MIKEATMLFRDSFKLCGVGGSHKDTPSKTFDTLQDPRVTFIF